MPKRKAPKPVVHIGRLKARGRVLRDLLHLRGSASVRIDVMEVAADIGGDMLNAKIGERRKRGKKRRRLLPPGAVTHAVLAVASLGCAVAASGIAYAFGWG